MSLYVWIDSAHWRYGLGWRTAHSRSAVSLSLDAALLLFMYLFFLGERKGNICSAQLYV